MRVRRGDESQEAKEQSVAIITATAEMIRDDGKDDHEHDLVMPGFRFHPTEEELIEFYLRRKVEGKRFNVELITFLDLYHYDPWELPGLIQLHLTMCIFFLLFVGKLRFIDLDFA